jgi:hypothetical protein
MVRLVSSRSDATWRLADVSLISAAHGGQSWLVARPEGGAEAGFSLPAGQAGDLVG